MEMPQLLIAQQECLKKKRFSCLCPFYERKLGGIRGLGFLRESLSHCCNLSILLWNFLSVDVGRLSDHVNSCVLITCVFVRCNLHNNTIVPSTQVGKRKTEES